MFETLPQQPQHPQHFHRHPFLQKLHYRSSPVDASPVHARIQSPLELCNTNIKPAIFPMMSRTCESEDKKDSGGDGTSNKENNETCMAHQQSTSIFSCVPTSSPRQSTYEQRFKSSSSNNPLSKIFGSPTIPSSTPSSRARKQRAIFLNKVKQNHDDARFNARGESLMMMEHVSEQRYWHERMRQKADMIFQQYQLDAGELSDEDSGGSSGEMAVDCEQDALEQFLSQEQEMDALLENMTENQNIQNPSPTKSERSLYGDDDEDLDDIFMQFVGNVEHNTQDMDMSG